VQTVRGLSLSNKIKIQTDTRDRLYFDRWQYSIAVLQSRISDIRGLDLQSTKKLIEYRSSSRFLQGHYTPNVITNIYAALNFFAAESNPFKLTLSGNWAYIYTNDATLAKRLISACPAAKVRFVKQAEVSQPRDAVMLSHSNFAYRTYLRSMWVDDQQIVNLDSFFTTQNNVNVSPCKSFQKFLKSNKAYKSHWLANHYFIDHNDPGYPLMLSLVLPRVVRKTLPIVQRINN
jgi:hypothetical protein